MLLYILRIRNREKILNVGRWRGFFVLMVKAADWGIVQTGGMEKLLRRGVVDSRVDCSPLLLLLVSFTGETSVGRVSGGGGGADCGHRAPVSPPPRSNEC